MSGRVIDTRGFDSLIPLLASLGYTVVAPTMHEGVIVYDTVRDASELPIGWTDDHGPGTYRTRRRDDNAYFGYVVGPRTLRAFLTPPQQTLLTITHAETGLAFRPEPPDEAAYAFIGVRSCELAAQAIQDRVLLESSFSDPRYGSLRARSFTVAVNCAVSGSTCFCTSMDTGPECLTGYDLVVTEIIDDGRHEFMVEAGTETGAAVLDRLEGRDSTPSDGEEVASILAETVRSIEHAMPDVDTYHLLMDNLEHPIWDAIAQRCLSCTNCTLVCPTCFCSTVSDVTDLEDTASRQRTWDSCFSLDFTNLHGHPVRSSPGARYRQWITHKLAYWHDQFDSSGCVGCGRCITWCPVGIDITQEIRQLNDDRKAVVI
ncbi:MAG: 4Fe-4S dicluster domain-containing protein [Actinomycetia bacterium]|nr:4Fe-4S dicluster domain-containing protein [Actinomycetes bacterium]